MSLTFVCKWERRVSPSPNKPVKIICRSHLLGWFRTVPAQLLMHIHNMPIRLETTLKARGRRSRGWWRGSGLRRKISKPRAASPWRDTCTYRRNVCSKKKKPSHSCSSAPAWHCISAPSGPLGSVWTRYYCTYQKSSKMFTMSNTESRPASRQVGYIYCTCVSHRLSICHQILTKPRRCVTERRSERSTGDFQAALVCQEEEGLHRQALLLRYRGGGEVRETGWGWYRHDTVIGIIVFGWIYYPSLRRQGVITLQALSEANRRLWMEAMDGKEPVRIFLILSLCFSCYRAHWVKTPCSTNLHILSIFNTTPYIVLLLLC